MIKKFLTILFLIGNISVQAQNLHIVRNTEGKYGFADEYGDTLIDCKFDYAENFSEGLALVKNNLQLKIIDTTGRLYNLSEYDGSNKFRHDLGEYHTGLPVIVKVWDCGYITSAGDYFLKLPYTDATSFKNGKAKVYNGDRYNYISKNGLLLDSWVKDNEDYHAIKNNGKFGFIDQNGKLVIDYKYAGATDFIDGYARVSNGNYWAIINTKGERISDWYEKIDPFKGNVAIVHKLGNIGFINKEGKFSGQWYQEIQPLDYGMFKVKRYDKYALANQDGYLVTQWFDDIGEYKNGFIKVRKNDKYTYLNNIGAMVIGWFDQLGDVKDGIIKIENGNQYGFYNVESFYISPFYDYLGDFVEGFAIVGKEGKYTFVNKRGKQLFPFEMDTCYNFSGGLAKVTKNNKAAYINTKGDIVMGWFDVKKYLESEPPRGIIVAKIGNKYYFESLNGRRIFSTGFDDAENFNEGLALVKNNPKTMYITQDGILVEPDKAKDIKNLRLDLGVGHSGKPLEVTKWDCAFIDYSGDVKIDLSEYSNAHSFSNGKAMVIKGDKYNFIDKTGKLTGEWKNFPDEYHAAFKKGKYGFIDKNGKLVINYQFDYAEDFHNGLAKVRIGNRTTGKFAYIDKTGKYRTKFYSNLTNFNNGLAIATLNNKYAIIDTTGTELSAWYDQIYPFSEGLARIVKNGKYSFINRQGKQFKDFFDDADNFKNGRAKIKLMNKWGFIDRTGEIVVYPKYDKVWNFQNNIARVEKDGKFAFIDLNGKLITDWFDRLYMFSDDRAVIAVGNKWGYVDINGKIVIKPKFDKAFAFAGGKAMVIKDGKPIYIDKDGNKIENSKN